MNPNVPSKTMLDALTGVRFFAALHVVLFHNIDVFRGCPDLVWQFLKNGYVGVSLFFVLSGFILAINYVRIGSQGSLEITVTLGEFWLARFVRIYPVYLTSLLLAFPLFVYFLYKTLPTHFFLIKASVVAFFNFILLEAWIPQTLGQFNAPGWSLSVEAFLYITFPFVALWAFKQSEKRFTLFVALLWLIALTPSLCIFLFDPEAMNIRLLPAELQSPYPAFNTFFSAFPVFHLPQFVIGISFAAFFLLKSWPAKLCNNSLRFLELFVFLMIIIALCQNYSIGVMLNNGLIAPLFGMFFLLLADGRGFLAGLFSRKMFLNLGDASYCIYIFQQPVLGYMKVIFKKLNVNYDTTSFVLYLIILIALSLIITGVDNKYRKKIKNSIKSRLPDSTIFNIRNQPTNETI